MRLIDAEGLKISIAKKIKVDSYEKDDVINGVLQTIDEQPTVEINGNTSDGYHTFNELYHHRAILFAVICNANKDKAWKSKKHSDGTMYDGMFIVGINTPHGEYTYHYDIEPYWKLFDVKTLEFAPEWDGHKPEDIDRLLSLPAFGQWNKLTFKFSTGWIISVKGLPSYDEMVLVTDGEHVWIDCFRVDDGFYIGDGVYLDSETKIKDVIAWMPLPEPPKGGTIDD